MHIKFLKHGKGSPHKASAYLLDTKDYKGEVRAGVEVLRGDASTFNAVCDSSPHLWKYTSGVIAWAAEDAPTAEQIEEVLEKFEQHAFTGLDKSQYHIFAVQHTDADGSKHIHVLTPRLDIQSGKSLNIAPPQHEKHFDSLRDYFNTKYQWSRPDDILRGKSIQEPNHIQKLNRQAEKILSHQDFQLMKSKQIHSALDNYIKTMIKTQVVKNQLDVANCLNQLEGIKSAKPHNNYILITLENDKNLRLRGDFYNAEFEIGLYSERLTAAEESRQTATELAAALADATNIRDEYQAKREAYHRQHHNHRTDTTNGNAVINSAQLASVTSRSLESIDDTSTHAGLHIANRKLNPNTTIYRLIEDDSSTRSNGLIFNINRSTKQKRQSTVTRLQDRQVSNISIDHETSHINNQQYKQIRNTKPAHSAHYRTTDTTKVEAFSDRLINSCDVIIFNQFLSFLSSEYKQRVNSQSTASNSRKQQNNQQFTIGKSHEVGNRSHFIREESIIAATEQFIEKHHLRLRDAKIEFSKSSKTIGNDLTPTAADNLSTKLTTISTFAIELATRFNKLIRKQDNNEIEYSKSSTNSGAREIETFGGEFKISNINTFVTELSRDYRLRFSRIKYTNSRSYEQAREVRNANQRLDRLVLNATEIKLKPRLAANFQIRSDGYYRDRVLFLNELSQQQDNIFFNSKKPSPIALINITAKKIDEIQDYIKRAENSFSSDDVNTIEKIIRNDQRMLKYLNCKAILEPQNEDLVEQRQTYSNLIKNIENIKQKINNFRNPIFDVEPFFEDQPKSQLKPTPGPSVDF